jgi:hypothetical protein
MTRYNILKGTLPSVLEIKIGKGKATVVLTHARKKYG